MWKSKEFPKVKKKNNTKDIHGDGSYIRDWTYVKDNIDGIYKTCFTDKVNQVWNISSNNCLSNLEVLEKVSKWVGKKPKINFIENRHGQDMRYSISSDKIRNELGWNPKHQTLYNFL